MKFHDNQLVLCINDHYNSYCRFPVKWGRVYTIHGYYKCTCGSVQVTLEEISGVTEMGCKCSNTSYRRHSYFSWRFVPFEYSELVEETHKEMKEELVAVLD
jgi:hypothetical protein